MEILFYAIASVFILFFLGVMVYTVILKLKKGDLTFAELCNKAVLIMKIADCAADSSGPEDFLKRIKVMYLSGEFNPVLKDMLLSLVIEFGKRRTNGFDFGKILAGVQEIKQEDSE